MFNSRLKDEIRVAAIIDRVQVYAERRGVAEEMCRVYLRKIDHLYYKFDPSVLKHKAVRIFLSFLESYFDNILFYFSW